MLGNHTDHNHGKTLATTCSLMIEGAYGKQDDNKVRLVSKGQCDFEICLDNTEYVEEKVDKSACFIRGIADYLKNKYRSNRISGDPSTEIVVAVDECLFEHEEDGSKG